MQVDNSYHSGYYPNFKHNIKEKVMANKSEEVMSARVVTPMTPSTKSDLKLLCHWQRVDMADVIRSLIAGYVAANKGELTKAKRAAK